MKAAEIKLSIQDKSKEEAQISKDISDLTKLINALPSQKFVLKYCEKYYQMIIFQISLFLCSLSWNGLAQIALHRLGRISSEFRKQLPAGSFSNFAKADYWIKEGEIMFTSDENQYVNERAAIAFLFIYFIRIPNVS